MLDRRTSLLLGKINALCEEGSYKIVEESELLSCFPTKLKADAEGLRQMLRFLRENRYIDIRYAEDGVYCLCPLPEGRRYFEGETQTEGGFFRRRAFMLFTAAGAFFGALLGSVAAWILSCLF